MRRAVQLAPLVFIAALLLPMQSAAADVPTAARATWQTNGIVRAVVYHGGAVYIGGEFTSVRPPGAASGTGEVARNHVAALSATTGALLPFKHDLNGIVQSLAISSGGTRIYAGGDFTRVDGAVRNHVAAFDSASGALTSEWRPSVSGHVKSLSVSGTRVYVGGTFSSAGGQPRTNVAAFDASTGALLPFRVTPDSSVRAVMGSADGTRLVLGGSFNHVNGVARRALAIVSTGATPTVIAQQSSIPTCSQVTTLARTATTVFVGAEGTGSGCFDGTLALNPATGAQLWRDNCLGATQGLAVIGTWLYVGSHAHDCHTVVGGFPQGPANHAHHLMRESVSNGHIDSTWFPNTNGNPLGPRVLATDGVRLGIGGDFTTVNTKPQQGFGQLG
jgi:outer membrane protein assembly factor BamB